MHQSSTPSNKYAPTEAIVGAVPVRAARREHQPTRKKIQRTLVQSLCKL